MKKHLSKIKISKFKQKLKKVSPSDVITIAAFLIMAIFILVTMQIITQQIKLYSKKTAPIVPASLPSFIASIDTAGESYDMQGDPLARADIESHIKLAATLNTNYITVDTDWDYLDYLQEWVDAIRKTGKHVWFKGHPIQWETGENGVMTPSQYIDYEKNFIAQHPTLFKQGDIFESCPEPENGKYWGTIYGQNWQKNAPNAATKEYNQFIRDTVDAADISFQSANISGVITRVYSVQSSIALNPALLESATINKLGVITVESFPEGNTTNPKIAAQLQSDQLNQIHQIQNVPIILGKMGYSYMANVDDATQQDVLESEFTAIKKLAFVQGLNYWVSVGTNHTGNSYLFKGSSGKWSLRQASTVVKTFFMDELTIVPSPAITIKK